MTNRGRPSHCGICESSILPSVCTVCVNYRLNDYYNLLKSLKSRRNQLYSRLGDSLAAKVICSSLQHICCASRINTVAKADEQLNWKVSKNEIILGLKEKLRDRREQLRQSKSKLEKMSNDLKVRSKLLDSSKVMLEKHRAEQLEKSYPNWIYTQSLGYMAITSERLHKQSVVVKQICKLFPQRRIKVEHEKNDGFNGQYDVICNARLPRGLNPHSVPAKELAASLGYMVQLLNLVVHSLGLPALHNSGYAGSCSRIWQRDSYWNARPSSPSNEYPLFIPRQNYCSTEGENSWSDRSSGNFEVTTVESEKNPHLDPSGSISFKYSSASPHSMETHVDLQKGIALLKKSVACITAYCYNSLCVDVPTDLSTFEAFAKLLAILSSSKEVRSVFSFKMACSRSCKQVQQMNKSVWNTNSMIASNTMMDSSLGLSLLRNMYDKNRPDSPASFLYGIETANTGKNENDEWDLVEHPHFPPPPSQTEDIEHWTRAMFTDARKK